MIPKLFSLFVLLALALPGAISVEAKTFPMTTTESVPAASGKVKVKKDQNGNTDVTLKADHLAQPGMLTPPSTVYVVWFQAEGSNPSNQGQLKVGKNLKGEFKATTRLDNFDVFVTAETDPLVKKPTGETVLRANVQEAD